MKTLVWLRHDLRMGDNPALAAAAKEGKVLPVFVLDDEAAGDWAPGAASNWRLHQSLQALQKEMPLLLLRGDARDVIPALVQEHGCNAVRWNRLYEPWAVKRDSEIKSFLKDELGVEVESHKAHLLFEPWEIRNGSGTPFKVFTPFWRACMAKQDTIGTPLPAPKDVDWVKAEGETLESWNLLPSKPDWATGFDPEAGEAAALARLMEFIEDGMAHYDTARDVPGVDGTSGLSAALHFGEISSRTAFTLVAKAGGAGMDRFLAELGWREFCAQLLYHAPTLPEENWKPEFDAYPWQSDETLLRAWQVGQTGYPLVDAGMRELWATGRMHNRVRMVTASFLIKHLRMDWREGQKWFWDTLVDADLASNAANWQWVAGSGADASPYFRIFSPHGQGEKFDGNGAYVRRWCPELKAMPDKYIQTPWLADSMTLKMAGVELGTTYPKPIVNHEAARKAALDGFDAVKGAKLGDD